MNNYLKFVVLTGEKEVFKGTKIYDIARDWTPIPTFHFDFNSISFTTLTPDEFDKSFHVTIQDTLTTDFKQFIYPANWDSASLGRKWEVIGKQLGKFAVLVDEYDRPITTFISHKSDIEKAQLFSSKLAGFFSSLKAETVNPFLKFMFVTGVSKFSKTSLFSSFNYLDSQRTS